MKTKLILQASVAILIVVCLHAYSSKYKYISDGSFIDIHLSRLDSSEELQQAFKDIMGQKDDSDRFRVLLITNGPACFKFMQCNNCPEGIPMFSLFCYQNIASGAWILRGYMPINDYYYTANPGRNFWDQTLSAFNEGEYTKVVFRNSIIFTITTNWTHVDF